MSWLQANDTCRQPAAVLASYIALPFPCFTTSEHTLLLQAPEEPGRMSNARIAHLRDLRSYLTAQPLLVDAD